MTGRRARRAAGVASAAVVLAVVAPGLVVPARAAPGDCTTVCWVDAVGGDDATKHGTAPSDAFQTLQKALDTVSAGGTVHAAPGLYAPNVTQVGRSVTLLGAQAGVDPSTRDASDAATESIVKSNTGLSIIGPAAQVTIDGFVFQEKTAGLSAGISTGTGGSDVGAAVTVTRCIFSAMNIGIASILGTNPSSLSIAGNRWVGGGTGILINGTHGTATLAIATNRFDDLAGSAVQVLVWSGATITSNLVQGQTGVNDPIFVGGCAGCTISGNTVAASGGSEAISLIGSNGDSTDCAIRNNTITNPTRSDNFGIYIGLATGTTIDGNTITGAREAGIASDPDSTITNNTVASAGGANTTGIHLRGATTGSVVSGNTVSGAAVGIAVDQGAGSLGTHVNRNAIAGNAAGLTNGAAVLVDAACNWWGDPSGPSGTGPGSGDSVSTNVTFNPWLLGSDLATASCAATGTTTTTTTIPATPCPAVPRDDCAPAAAAKASLVLKRKPGLQKKDALSWSWRSSGAVAKADFGSPLGATSYSLCLYDATPGAPLRLIANVPAGGTCAGKPCWKATKSGFKYKDKELTPDGLKVVALRAGAAGKGRVVVKGKGPNAHVPPLPLALPVRVQLLRSDAGVCWGAVFTAAKKNQSTLLKAKSDP